MEVFSTKCPTCSAKIPFDPKSQLWVCDYCGGRFTAEQIKSFEENNKDQNEDNENAQKEQIEHNYDVKVKENKDDDSSEINNDEFDLYTCENCGAQIVADKNTAATFCVYCGGYTLIKDRLVGNFKPQYIIPFQTTKEDAVSEYMKYIDSRTFVPNSFKSPNNIEKLTGVYIPFWTYDSDLRVQKSGYGTTVRTWRSGNYEYTETSEFKFDRDVIVSFDDVPVDGSQKFDDDLMDSIEPFDYSKKKEFDSRYLSGFLAEKYDVDKEAAYERAQLRMINSSNQKVDSSIPYAAPRISSVNMSEDKGEVLYWLLPVWMLNTKYNDKMYQFAMNGESGKVVGNFPISFKKVLIMLISLFAILFGLLYIGESFYNYTENSRFPLVSAPTFIYLIFLIILLVLFYYNFVIKPSRYMKGGKKK
ncbi:MAG: hypothetical protein IKI57_02185 [Clostridia bacterium]|nr:hypothetical protein [Clostridia bacterium]